MAIDTPSRRNLNNNGSRGFAASARQSDPKELHVSKQNKPSQGGPKSSYEPATPQSQHQTPARTNRLSGAPHQSQPSEKTTPASQQPSPEPKSILRVNLIKKSTRHVNIFALNKSSRKTEQVASANHKQTTHHPKSATATTTTTTTTSDKKHNTNVAHQKQGATNNIQEAKESQKLVVSLLKRISETVSRQELEKILAEINEAVKEIQLDGGPAGNKGGTTRKSLQSPKRSNQQANNKLPKTASIKIQPPNENRSDMEETSSARNQQATLSNAERSDDETSEIRPDRTSKTGGRLPERCLRLTSSHAKFISPHRKRSLEERLSRAQEAREKFLEYKANKFRDILKKVEEMRAWKEEDTMNLKASVQVKLERAEAKRKEQLDRIIKKAHDEDSKVSEIQFINNLMAQNRRHDINSRKKEFESRLQELQEERQKRFEEKQAKEVAAEERRKALEAERKAKLLEIQRQRKLKTQKVEQQQRVKESRRIESNRTREQKISAIKEAYKENVQSLKKRINKKQEQSELRHEVNLRLIRQKAFELSIKRYNYYATTGSQQQSAAQALDSAAATVTGAGGIGGSAATLIGSDSSAATSHNHNNKCARLQLKPFNTKKFCNLCKETIGSEMALFSHLRSDNHYAAINEHYINTTLTTNEAVEIHNLRHIIDTDEPLDNATENQHQQQQQQQQQASSSASSTAAAASQQSSRASSLVNYYHSSHFNHASGISMSESDRESLIAIEKRCRKLRGRLIVAGKPFNRDRFVGKIRHRLAQLMIQQRILRKQPTNVDLTTLANTIDLSANNAACQHNKPFYLKITRITRELISLTTDQRISGGGLLPNGIIHSVDRLLADLNKQLASRKVPEISAQLLLALQELELEASCEPSASSSPGGVSDKAGATTSADQLSGAIKTMELYAIDTLFVYDIISCLVSILRRMVPNVSLTSKLPSTLACHSGQLIDPASLHSYWYNRSPVLQPRIYIKMIGLLRGLCQEATADICYMVFASNNMIHLSDILAYRLGFIIGNESPTASISGSSSAATLSAAQSTLEQPPTARFAASRQLSTTTTTTCNEGTGSEEEEEEDDYGEEEEEEGEEEESSDQEVQANNAGDAWPETYRRSEEIVDDMTAGLCKLLATLTETILERPLVLLNQVERRAFDERSDDFISYMVSVGIVDTESVIMSHVHRRQAPAAAQAAAKIIHFSTACLQFVSSLVKLVISKLASGAGDDRCALERDSTRLLATLKITQVSDVFTLLYDLLVHSSQANSSSEPQLRLVLECLRLANYVAYIDAKLLQETLAHDEMLALQLRHVAGHLLAELTSLAPASDQHSDHHQQLRKTLLNETILLLGHFAYLNPQNQASLESGPRRPTVVEQLIGLPFDYFARAPLKLILMPTLVSCAHLNAQVCARVRQDLSLSMLASFIEDQLLAAQVGASASAAAAGVAAGAPAHTQRAERLLAARHWPLVAPELANNKLESLRWQFERRFAKCEWLAAKRYFEERAGNG